MSLGSFWGVLAATVLAGFYNANAQLYRLPGPNWWRRSKAQAISFVMAGGVAGAFIGPNLANATRDLLPAPFAGAYVTLVGVALLGLAVMSAIRFPAHVRPAPAAIPAARWPSWRGSLRSSSRWRRGALVRRDEPADGGHAGWPCSAADCPSATRRW